MKKFLRLFVLEVTDLKLNSFWEADREAMIPTVPHSFTGIPAEQILAPQVVFDCLKDCCPIYGSGVWRNRERCLKVADEKILAAGFLGEFAKTLCWWTHCQPPITRLEERQVNHIKRYVVAERRLNYRVRLDGARSIQSVTNQYYEPALGTNLRQSVKSSNRGECGVED